MTANTIEDGIRNYLESLGSSGKPRVDREAVKSLKAQIRNETDQLNKLKLIVALQEEEQGRAPDRSGLRAVFIAEAKAWADAEGITPEAFQELGVPDDDLTAAGFTVTARSSRSRRRSASSSSGGTRAPRLALDQVKAAAADLGPQWKLSDLAEAIERDTATARNYLNKLVEDGSVTLIGDDPTHDGRGRAPKLYST